MHNPFSETCNRYLPFFRIMDIEIAVISRYIGTICKFSLEFKQFPLKIKCYFVGTKMLSGQSAKTFRRGR